MRKAGAIISIIAGIFAVIMALFTLVVGGMGKQFNADGASTVLGLGWGGVFFSFVVIVLGVVGIVSDKRLIGILLIICSLFGAILGGSLVAIFMFLSLIGGILSLIGTRKKQIKE